MHSINSLFKWGDLLERTNTSPALRIPQSIPLTRSVTEWSTESGGFENTENDLQHQQPSMEDNVEEDFPGQDPYGDEDEDFAIRPLSK